MNLDPFGLDEYGRYSLFFEPNQIGLVVHLRLIGSIFDNKENGQRRNVDDYWMLVAVDQLCSRTSYSFRREKPGMLKPVQSVRNMRHIVPLGLDGTWRLITVSTFAIRRAHNEAPPEMDAAAIACLLSGLAVRCAREKPDRHVRGKSLSPLATDPLGWHRPSFPGVCQKGRSWNGSAGRSEQSACSGSYRCERSKNGVVSLPGKRVTTPIEFLPAC